MKLKMSHHHTNFLFGVFLGHGVMDYIFFMACCHKNTCCEKYKLFFGGFSSKSFWAHSPPSYVHFCISITCLYMIHQFIYTIYMNA